MILNLIDFRNRLIKLFLSILLICCVNLSFSQISLYSGISWPDNILKTYPFLKDSIYEIVCPETNGFQGYAVFMFDKSKLQNFLTPMVNHIVDSTLRANNFFKEGRCTGIDSKCFGHLILHDYKLNIIPPTYTVGAFKTLYTSFEYNIQAIQTGYSYHTGCGQSCWPWDWVVCQESQSSSGIQLASAYLSSQISLGADANHNLCLMDHLSAYIHKDACCCDPFTIVDYSGSAPPYVIKTADINRCVDLKGFGDVVGFKSVKQINIIEDASTYYIYCLK